MKNSTLPKMIARLFITICITIFFTTCKKEDEGGEIKLTVVEYGSTKPVKNAAVGLLERTTSSVFGGGSYSIVATANTNALGQVNFGHYSSWKNLYIDVQHPDYIDISNTSVTEVAKQNSSIVISGISFVSVRFFNIYNRDKPGTILAYGFDPYRGGGGQTH